jgi:hypothetical protein
MHAIPFEQQVLPHGVVPEGQQQPVAGLEQLSPFWQQTDPQVEVPAGHPAA